MKLNCDMGESFGAWSMGLDDHVMPYIDQANIACGFHAGDPMVMAQTLANAKQHHIDIGAHPSYPDLVGFGRRSMALSEKELKHTLQFQISALAGMAQLQGLTLSYVKPHGALYNDMMVNTHIRQTVMQSIAEFPMDLSLMLLGTANYEQHQEEASAHHLTLQFEAFADRCYTDEGHLVSRQFKHAVLTETQMFAQVTRLVCEGSVHSEHGQALSFPVDSLCVHGDNDTAVQNVQHIRQLITTHEH